MRAITRSRNTGSSTTSKPEPVIDHAEDVVEQREQVAVVRPGGATGARRGARPAPAISVRLASRRRQSIDLGPGGHLDIESFLIRRRRSAGLLEQNPQLSIGMRRTDMGQDHAPDPGVCARPAPPPRPRRCVLSARTPPHRTYPLSTPNRALSPTEKPQVSGVANPKTSRPCPKSSQRRCSGCRVVARAMG